MADPSSSQQGALQPNRNWHAKRDAVVEGQAVDLPEIGSFNLYKTTPPLKERTELDAWVDQVEKILRSHKLHNLINNKIPWPVVDDPNGDKWYTLSLQVRTWISSSIDNELMQEINARGNSVDFADELLAEIKKHMKGWSESWGALQNDMNLLLVGGNGDVRAVAILKWDLNRRTSVVRGFVELYVRDRHGIPVQRQREEIFPPPCGTTAPQRLTLTRQEVFGPYLSDPRRTQPPNDTVYLEIDTLRTVASRALARMNLSPAV